MFMCAPSLDTPAKIRQLLLESTLWYDVKPWGYLGAYLKAGLHHQLLLQVKSKHGAHWKQAMWYAEFMRRIECMPCSQCFFDLQVAQELSHALPRVFGNGQHNLTQMWAYKYDSSMQGINIHGDTAAVNLNLWLTPDSANLVSLCTLYRSAIQYGLMCFTQDPTSGGLVVYKTKAPGNWSFAQMNKDKSIIHKVDGFCVNQLLFVHCYQLLDSSGYESITIPHRQNRVVIFDSVLFHKTDSFLFKDGYGNRRINLTFLYGRRPEQIIDEWRVICSNLFF